MIRPCCVVLAIIVLVGPAGAQRCATPSATAAWLVAQQEELTERPGSWSNDSLRTMLMFAASMNSRVEPHMGWELRTGDVERLSTHEGLDYLRAAAAAGGPAWPGRSAVGVAGVHAVFSLALRDTALLRATLKRMAEAGPKEGISSDIAILEDHARMSAGRKQLYGTLLIPGRRGKVVPAPIEDSTHVDQRRESAHLPPLSWSVCNANATLRK